MTLFGNRVSENDQVKVRSLGWALPFITGFLRKRGNLDTETGMHRGKLM